MGSRGGGGRGGSRLGAGEAQAISRYDTLP